MTEETPKLTPEEQKILKELLSNLAATSRVMRYVKTILLWLATTLGAGWAVWELLLKHKGG